jgi:hypothetical protein
LGLSHTRSHFWVSIYIPNQQKVQWFCPFSDTNWILLLNMVTHTHGYIYIYTHTHTHIIEKPNSFLQDV